MSSGLSADQIIKNEVAAAVAVFPNITLRIFPESSNDDQKLVSEGGLTFSYNGVNYGSCDAGWFKTEEKNGEKVYTPIIALEGTDALNRGSSGDAQYQRFHHALGAVKNGYIGVYYLRPGTSSLQLDLFEMAYNATQHENGYYIIIQDLSIVSDLLSLIDSFGYPSHQVCDFLDSYEEYMHKTWYEKKFSQYNYDWNEFAKKRSTILGDNYIIKYAGRMRRNYTDGSQRAGHIAVGEMFLSKYLFYGKTVYYLCPRMSAEDITYLDSHKNDDKEWHLLRHEQNVIYMTRDNIVGLPETIIDKLSQISSEPLKNGTPAKRIYDECIKFIVNGLSNHTLSISQN